MLIAEDYSTAIHCRYELCRLIASLKILSFVAATDDGWPRRAAAEHGSRVDFTRDVRPILADNCFHCHGPEGRAAGRLAARCLGERRRHPRRRRLSSPRAAGRERTGRSHHERGPGRCGCRRPIRAKRSRPEQIETLRQWIAQGAEIQAALGVRAAPQRPAVPAVKNQAWVRNPIDAFVLARLEKEGLEPSPAPTANTLLAPAVARPDRPAADARRDRRIRCGSRSSAGATTSRSSGCSRRLTIGERWGRLWLDAARYADSDGFEKDKPRIVWMYRDWVDQRAQRRHALRPVHHRADRRRPAARRRRRTSSSPPASCATR